jgi:hypothetical protein
MRFFNNRQAARHWLAAPRLAPLGSLNNRQAARHWLAAAPRLAPLGSLILLAGCGFLGEEPFSGRRVADVAPWQDIGLLTVCDGDVRLGASPAGFCNAVPTRACDACKSRERCICGACRPLYCDGAADCGAGFACNSNRCEKSCATSDDCAAGESCVEGRNVCRGNCSGDGDCQTGETCNLASGECAASACVDDSGCACALQRRPADLRHPAPLPENGGVTMWLERDGEIVRATSSDGLDFHIDGAVFAGRSPSVAAGYLMVFASGGSLYRAASSDGRTFDKPALLFAGDEPSLVRLEKSWALYFTSGGDVLRSLSADGVSFSAPQTVLRPEQLIDPTLWRNVDRIASPFAQALVDVAGRRFIRLWFAARGQESGPAYNFDHFEEVPANFSIGEAASPPGDGDGVEFTPYPFNPVFDRVEMFIQHPSELDPALVPLGDEQLLYYRRASADGSVSGPLGVARSPALPR